MITLGNVNYVGQFLGVVVLVALRGRDDPANL